MNYIRNCPWLNISLKLNAEIDSKLLDISHKIDASAGGSGRSDSIRNITNALSTISANVLRQYSLSTHRNLKIDLSNDAYPKGPFNPNRIGVHSFRKVINYMKANNPAYINIAGGNYDRVSGVGYPTQIVGTDEFLDLLFKLISRENSNKYSIYPITRKTFNMDIYCRLHGDIFDTSLIPSIRLREGSTRERPAFIQFSESDETKRMEVNIAKYNEFLGRQWIDIFATDKEILDIKRDSEERIDDFGSIEPSSSLVDLVSGRSLYRVFNNGKFTDGGRFYGGWWQGIPSSHRRLTTINGIPTVEVDFSGMQIAMLYARIGRDLEGDAYAIEGIDSCYRGLIKTATLKLINATGRSSAPLKSALPENMTWKELQEAIKQRHAPIAKFLGSGEGIRLQRLDSDIAEDVIMDMLGRGIVTHP